MSLALAGSLLFSNLKILGFYGLISFCICKVYEEISDHFSETRHTPWPNIVEFCKSFRTGQILIDVGCGNGKYFGQQADNVSLYQASFILPQSSILPQFFFYSLYVFFGTGGYRRQCTSGRCLYPEGHRSHERRLCKSPVPVRNCRRCFVHRSHPSSGITC